jgi:hypothetical protein
MRFASGGLFRYRPRRLGHQARLQARADTILGIGDCYGGVGRADTPHIGGATAPESSP